VTIISIIIFFIFRDHLFPCESNKNDGSYFIFYTLDLCEKKP